ncbi:hypothetical protein [Neisseria sp. CCUG12390]|uniref:hypothetical protein n=1 Tax=Neisseria sp. CCUG12390 TaxID=3392035 RepID=UPI003A0FDA4A
MSNRPTVVLGMPTDNQIYRTLEAALTHHGFRVISVIQPGQDFRYPSWTSRLSVKFRQLVLRDKNAKEKFKSQLLLNNMEQQLARNGGADYALFIRGDIYSPEFLRTVRKYVRRSMVNYQWDGLGRFPKIRQYMDLFDKFYVFDPADCAAESRVLPATNFYFDHNLTPTENPPHDLYFVGFHMPDRTESIAAFGRAAQKLHLDLDFHIGSMDISAEQLRTQYPDNIQVFNGVRSFEDNLKAAQTQAKILVDFKTPVHNGLSFRPFEALGYRKKLITTNAGIEQYDFYHPDNIFVWDGSNLDGLKAFIDRPYHEMPSEIYEKYSFSNWIRYILNIEPHIKITLPE